MRARTKLRASARLAAVPAVISASSISRSRGAEPDLSRGQILLAPGWIVVRGPGSALAAVLAEPELEVAGAGKLLCELVLEFADHRLVVPVPGREGRVSWLPGRLMDRNTAITAMTLAEVVVTDDVNPGHRLWLHIEGWSAELGLTAPDALTWISQPPGRVSSEKEAVVPEDPEAAGA